MPKRKTLSLLTERRKRQGARRNRTTEQRNRDLECVRQAVRNLRQKRRQQILLQQQDHCQFMINQPTRYERERAAMKSKPRKVLNLEERVLAIRLYHDNPVYQRVASILKCSWEQIRNIIANRDDILRYYGECQTVTHKDSPQYVRNKKINFLGNVTYEFIKRAYYHRSLTLNDDVIRQWGIKFRDILQIQQFHPNRIWIADFKKVYNIDWQNLDSLVICGTPNRSLESKDLIEYCTRMVSKAVSLIGKVPKQLIKKETKNEKLTDDDGDEYDEASGVGGAGGGYDDNEDDSMLMDNNEDVPVVVNEVDDFAGMYLSNTGNDDDADNTGNGDFAGITTNYANYDASTADMHSHFNAAKSSASNAGQKESSSMSTQFVTEVQIKQERRSRSRSKSSSPLTVENTYESVKRGRVDDTATTAAAAATTASGAIAATAPKQSVKREPVNSYVEAMRALSPLEDFATQEENFQALNLLMQLSNVFEKGAKRKSERR